MADNRMVRLAEDVVLLVVALAPLVALFTTRAGVVNERTGDSQLDGSQAFGSGSR